MAEPVRVILVNPLGAALAHYAGSLAHSLSAGSAEVTTVTLVEPSASGQGRLRWIKNYIAALRRLGAEKTGNGRKSIVIQTWPVLGYWDHVLARICAKQPVTIVMHDPKPLVRAIGYGRIAKWTAARSCVKSRLIVHSKAAATAVRNREAGLPITELPHPMMPPQMLSNDTEGHTVIRVLGQYKADRDVDAMKRIAIEGPSQWRFEVVGRGWPPIEGWTVVDRFVEEVEFDALVQSSSAVVIPYVRFFQSGVAIRCLDWSVPVVGSGSSSLAELLGRDSSWLSHGMSWTTAVEAAVQTAPSDVHRVAIRIYQDVLQRWRMWLADCI
jgi:hypothetical protein